MNQETRYGLTSAAWNPRPSRRRSSWLRSIPREERANALTHAAGALAFAVLGAWLVDASLGSGSFALAASVCVFVAALLAMYVASALYHGSADAARKPFLRALDHCSIYLLIAGTYTPFAVALGGGWGALLLAIVWPAAAIGIALKLRAAIGRRWLSTAIYVAMGWVVVIAAHPFLQHFARPTLLWLAAGGLAYTAGTPFYLMSRRRPALHAWWHGFVIAGSAFHFIAVATLVLGATNATQG
ncbi:hemolysin III family protein [Lysobacter yananisis]|uniref:Hemolysin III family protein n=1 Tax=Lysobacter yananisis TaxID=1003114 RepID=A0ABY9P553_9GAMM|nr:hemolysin III family protein [Lysobacter yananisis]WMT02136.1 hemolysin III family protein [Lysobacter yananisis]